MLVSTPLARSLSAPTTVLYLRRVRRGAGYWTSSRQAASPDSGGTIVLTPPRGGMSKIGDDNRCGRDAGTDPRYAQEKRPYLYHRQVPEDVSNRETGHADGSSCSASPGPQLDNNWKYTQARKSWSADKLRRRAAGHSGHYGGHQIHRRSSLALCSSLRMAPEILVLARATETGDRSFVELACIRGEAGLVKDLVHEEFEEFVSSTIPRNSPEAASEGATEPRTTGISLSSSTAGSARSAGSRTRKSDAARAPFDHRPVCVSARLERPERLRTPRPALKPGETPAAGNICVPHPRLFPPVSPQHIERFIDAMQAVH